MFTAVLSALGGKFIEGFFQEATGLFKAYLNKEITEAQLKEKLLAAMLQSATTIEVAHSKALADTYSSFMGAVKDSKVMQRMWAITLASQVFVLFWFQWIVPFASMIVRDYYGVHGWHYPSPGATVQWAYLLIAGLCGMGPVVLRNGPGAGRIVERLKAAIGR